MLAGVHRRLSSRPAAKAALTSAVLMGSGDLICQGIQNKQRGTKRVDWHRAARFSLVGLTLHGPYFFFAFKALDGHFGPATTMRNVLTKVVAGQLTVFPIYVTAFFTYMNFLEGGTWATLQQRFPATAPKTLATGSCFWPVVNFFNFKFVPPAQRVPYVNVMGIIWNSFLRYWRDAATVSHLVVMSLPVFTTATTKN